MQKGLSRFGITPFFWCLGPELNRHGSHPPRDFKSLASTNSATQAIFVNLVRFEIINICFASLCQPPPLYHGRSYVRSSKRDW